MDQENQQLLASLTSDDLKKGNSTALDRLQRVKNNVKVNNQVGQQFWISLKELIDQLAALSKDQGSNDNRSYDWLESINGVFLILQNLCVNSLDNQSHIAENFLELLIGILNDLIDRIDCHHSQSITKSIRFCLRSFANLIAGEANRKPRQLLWTRLSPLIRKVMSLKDVSITPIVSMIIYTCHCDCDILDQSVNDQSLAIEMIRHSLDLLQDDTLSSEWNLYTLEAFISYTNFFSALFLQIDQPHRETLTDFIFHRLDKKDSVPILSRESISYLGELLSECLHDIFRLTGRQSTSACEEPHSSPMKLEAFELSKLLHLLAQLSSSESCNRLLRTNQSLVEQSIETLKCCQLLGKTKSGIGAKFEVISSLKKLNELSPEDDLAQEPVFGFKRDLIRLIGNLSYQCRQVQDWVRQKDGIPVILDCANLDARNPFITQWAVFAIRNLMEDNSSNREIIAGLAKNGILINSPLLNELGLKFEDGKISSL